MRTHFSKTAITFAALLALSGGTAAAAQQTAAPSESSGMTSDMSNTQAQPATGADSAADGAFITRQKSSQTLATSIIGLSVRNGPGKDAKEIGKVTDLILDKDHKLAGIVVGVGGFLGIGQKDVGIPWDKVSNLDPQAKVAQVSMGKEQLENAPTFTTQAEQENLEKQAQEKQKMQLQQQAQPPAGAGAPAPAPMAPAPQKQ